MTMCMTDVRVKKKKKEEKMKKKKKARKIGDKRWEEEGGGEKKQQSWHQFWCHSLHMPPLNQPSKIQVLITGISHLKSIFSELF